MDVTHALKSAENSLRDFIIDVLSRKLGRNWENISGVTAERIEKWRERKSIEAKNNAAVAIEDRLIYYADFYDIYTILDKNWNGEIKHALGDKKEIDIFLKQLDKFRNSDAHRRELFPHQKALVIGISGEIRTRIIRYRNKMENIEDFFPKLESIRDNLGNSWIPGKPKVINTNSILKVGDTLEFVVAATDPEGLELTYHINPGGKKTTDNNLIYEVTNDNIGKESRLTIGMSSPREYHAVAGNACDDWVTFIYSVLPNNRT